MRVIFLDIDGVLNSEEWFLSLEPADDDTCPIRELDPSKVELLNELVANTDAYIVVSSTWRLGFDLEDLEQILFSAGLDYGLLDYTPDISPDRRGEEIKAWLDRQGRGVESYVVLDDDTCVIVNTIPSHRVVGTTFKEGLQGDHVLRAIEVLSG